MKILGLGLPELLVILAVALLIFGPKNLPKLGSALGKTVKNLREGLGGDQQIEEEAEEEAEEEEAPETPAKKPAARKSSSTAKKSSKNSKGGSGK